MEINPRQSPPPPNPIPLTIEAARSSDSSFTTLTELQGTDENQLLILKVLFPRFLYISFAAQIFPESCRGLSVLSLLRLFLPLIFNQAIYFHLSSRGVQARPRLRYQSLALKEEGGPFSPPPAAMGKCCPALRLIPSIDHSFFSLTVPDVRSQPLLPPRSRVVIVRTSVWLRRLTAGSPRPHHFRDIAQFFSSETPPGFRRSQKGNRWFQPLRMPLPSLLDVAVKGRFDERRTWHRRIPLSLTLEFIFRSASLLSPVASP